MTHPLLTNPLFVAPGNVQVARLTAPDIVCSGQVRNPTNRLKLGGNTTLSGALSYLQIDTQSNGVHLTEATATQIWLDTPVTVSATLTASGGLATSGNLNVSGTLTVAGATSLQAVTAQGAAQFQSTVSTGALTASQLTATGTSSLQGAVTASSTVNVQGAAQFQNTVSTGALTAASATVSGTTTLTGAASLASTLQVTGATTVAALTASGATSLATLATSGTATIGGVLTASSDATVAGNLTVSGATGVNIASGSLSIKAANWSYDTTSAGFENAKLTINGNTALRVYNSDQHVAFTGGVVTNSLTAQTGQPLTLTGLDSAGTVKINGNLQVSGTIDETNVNTLQVADLQIILAHNASGAPLADSVADTAGIVVEGNSGYNRSILWHYNQGLAYKPGTQSQATGDGLSYWEMMGGNLRLTRVVPSANHLSYSSTTKTWSADNTATTVSFAFRIADDETLQVCKVSGTDYTTPASSGGGYSAVGSTAKLAGYFGGLTFQILAFSFGFQLADLCCHLLCRTFPGLLSCVAVILWRLKGAR